MVKRAPVDPNIITSMRLPMAPVAVAFLVTGTIWGTIVAAILALLLEVSDLLDGYVARRYEQVTDFGKLYDPFSDAFTRYTLFLGLYAIGVAQLWMVIAIFYRDAAISFFRTVAATREVVVAARPSGKIKALFQGFGMQFIFLFLVLTEVYPEWGAIQDVPYWIMVVITLVTIASFLDYFRGNLPTLRDAWENRPLLRKKKKGSPE
ncbi:MAG: CDP-alcohol phosphatidyltransferase family protein [Deltaproteobacteria bacterium]|nr:CDP-alcohol phosphatidyltransferase family protein [Deltaproteobacteria bacterium]MBW2256911.1 CDP-alcohol phosphatidyltransferase family protein [Deltaproteobacteria bacterium]